MRISLLHPIKRRPSVGPSDLLAMQARKEVRLAHYERFLGASFALSTGVEGAPFVDLCVVPPNPLKGRGHYTLVTDGLSDLPIFSSGERGDFPALEATAYAASVDGEAFAVAFMRKLARAMADPARAWKPWAPVSARDIDPSIPSDSRARHLMLLPPAHEWPGFERCRFTNGSEVRFLWAALLTPQESKAAQSTAEELLGKLKAADPASFLNPSRPSIV